MSGNLHTRELKPLRILHTSDCHLGHEIDTEPHGENGFERLVDIAVDEDVDAILVAGDLFDSNRVNDRTLNWTVNQLLRLKCPTVILPGDHDHCGTLSVFERFDLEAAVPGVYVISAPEGETVTVGDLGLTCWGRGIEVHDSKFRPLFGIPTRPLDSWNIVMGHGLFMRRPSPWPRGSPIYGEDLISHECDYIALGHVHTFEVLSLDPAPAVYSGSPAMSRQSEPGFVMVSMDPADGVTFRRQLLWPD